VPATAGCTLHLTRHPWRNLFSLPADKVFGRPLRGSLRGKCLENSSTLNLTSQLASDRSLTVLVLSNLLTIVLAVVQQWDVYVLMWIYWAQSVIIGYFNVHRILGLERFTTSGFMINNKPVKRNAEGKRQTALLFAMHYGIFHLGYMFYLISVSGLHGGFPLFGMLVCIFAFYLNHRFSYHYNREREREVIHNIGNLMAFPYVRIIPMHLMIVIGSRFLDNNSIALVFFLLLKSLADIAMHVIEHAMARGAARRARRRLP
jgi:hypothetical protein